MENDHGKELKRARRRESKRQRLGTPDPRCLSCGCLDLEALFAVPVADLPDWFLEKHHLGKRSAIGFTVALCRNCHAILTDWQQDWDDRLRHPKTPLERLAALLQGLADWLVQQARRLTDLAMGLRAWVGWLLGGMAGEAPA